MIVVTGMSCHVSTPSSRIVNSSSVNSILSLFSWFSFFSSFLYTRSENIPFFFLRKKKRIEKENCTFWEKYCMHLLIGKVSDFLGDTCARLIVGYDVQGRASWTNFTVKSNRGRTKCSTLRFVLSFLCVTSFLRSVASSTNFLNFANFSCHFVT